LPSVCVFWCVWAWVFVLWFCLPVCAAIVCICICLCVHTGACVCFHGSVCVCTLHTLGLIQGRAGLSVSTARRTPTLSAGSARAVCAEGSRTPTCSCCVTNVTWPSTSTASTHHSPLYQTTRTGELRYALPPFGGATLTHSHTVGSIPNVTLFPIQCMTMGPGQKYSSALCRE
jgi:hypothetical protein